MMDALTEMHEARRPTDVQRQLERCEAMVLIGRVQAELDYIDGERLLRLCQEGAFAPVVRPLVLPNGNRYLL